MRHRMLTAALVFLSGLFASSAQAGLEAWLSFGGTIKGDSTHPEHREWIDIMGFSFDASRTITPAVGGGGRVAGNAAMSEATLFKSVDTATAQLFQAATIGTTAYPKVTLDVNVGNDQPLARVEFENVLVSSHKFSGSGNAAPRPEESITLNFTKITFIHIEVNQNTNFASYDLTTNTSSSGSAPFIDTDNDGMRDTWESQYGLSVGVADANGDLDGDGLINIHEFQLGTLPNSGTSFFKAVLTPDPASTGNFQIQWNSVAGKSYVIEWSPDLTTPFTSIRTVTATAASTTENITRQGNLGLYRVRPQ
jgi:type VI secretion system secreted protein Hcp